MADHFSVSSCTCMPFDAQISYQNYLRSGGKWVYLGKSPENREKLIQQLGEPQGEILGEKLHQVAEDLRQPFLDLISRMGIAQKNQVDWWASTLSWKPISSDLFLLICYQAIFQEILENPHPHLIIIEDPWLYWQLKENFARGHIKVGKKLIFSCLRTLGLGALKRTRWASRILWNYFHQSWVWPGVTPEQGGIALYSLPQQRCLQGEEGWIDPYLANLDEVLAPAKMKIFRFSPPGVLGFEKQLARRSHYFWPLILDLRFSKLFQVFFHLWRPVWIPDMKIQNVSVKRLVYREYWHDLGLSSGCDYLLFYECVKSFLKQKKPQIVVFPYENQPWEKMILLAARELKIKVIGHQHSTVPRNFLAYFMGADEKGSLPLPDIITVSGDYSAQLLRAGGIPSEQLVPTGSLRYQHLAKKPLFSTQPSLNHILVVLPLDRRMVLHMLHALRRAFPDFGASLGLRFYLKVHPVFYHSLREVQEKFPVEILQGSFEEALKECGSVLCCGSTAGLEAWILGHNTLRYRSELLIDVDPCEVLGSDEMPVCSDYDLREKMLSSLQRQDRDFSISKAQELKEALFAPLSQAAWNSAVSRLMHVETIQ